VLRGKTVGDEGNGGVHRTNREIGFPAPTERECLPERRHDHQHDQASQPDARSGHREGAELGYGDAHEHEGGAPQGAEQQQLQEGPGIHATGTRWRSEKTRPQALAI